MKKTLMGASFLALTIAAGSAFAAPTNMENPLYAPAKGNFYSKTSVGVMYKEVDNNYIEKAKGDAGESQWPVYRVYEDLGFGITDRLAMWGAVSYTDNSDADRSGLSNGRLGLIYRILSEKSPMIWDVYGDIHLAGVSTMEADLVLAQNPQLKPLVFNYKNYTTGRYGIVGGTRFGKTWDDFTAAVFAEIHHSFGDDNNEINNEVPDAFFNALAGGAPIAAAFPTTIKVDLKSTNDYSTGLKSMWQIDEKWSLGGSFTYKYHANNKIADVNIDLKSLGNPLLDGGATAIANGLKAANMGNQKDGFNEYIFNASIARQLSDNTQVALYAEYTMDDAFSDNSQNTTSVKVEGGARLNLQF